MPAKFIVSDINENDLLDDENILHTYEDKESFLKGADEFYHEQFSQEDNYDETKDITTMGEAVRLWNGCDYAVYRCYEIIKK